MFVGGGRVVGGLLRQEQAAGGVDIDEPVNTDDEQALAGQFNIRGIPTLILFKHGREIGRQSGLMDTAGIESWVSRTLAA